MAGLMTFTHLINWQKIRFAYRCVLKPCIFLRKSLLNIDDSLYMMNEVRTILLNNYNIDSFLENDIDAVKSRIYLIKIMNLLLDKYVLLLCLYV